MIAEITPYMLWEEPYDDFGYERQEAIDRAEERNDYYESLGE